jgi:hypothetical protein
VAAARRPSRVQSAAWDGARSVNPAKAAYMVGSNMAI